MLKLSGAEFQNIYLGFEPYQKKKIVRISMNNTLFIENFNVDFDGEPPRGACWFSFDGKSEMVEFEAEFCSGDYRESVCKVSETVENVIDGKIEIVHMWISHRWMVSKEENDQLKLSQEKCVREILFELVRIFRLPSMKDFRQSLSRKKLETINLELELPSIDDLSLLTSKFDVYDSNISTVVDPKDSVVELSISGLTTDNVWVYVVVPAGQMEEFKDCITKIKASEMVKRLTHDNDGML